MRTTRKQLEGLCATINRITGSPSEHATGRTWNVGHFMISSAYGGYELQRVDNDSGGVSCPIGNGHGPARELADQMRAFIRGLEFARYEPTKPA